MVISLDHISSLNNITLVTCLFDIGRGKLEGDWRREFSTYLGWFVDLLSAELPIIIYCEESLNNFILNIRSKNTYTVNMRLDDFRSEWYYEKVQKIRTSEEWLNSTHWLRWSPQGALELYNPVVMNKQYMMDKAVTIDPFSTEYFVWVDAGAANTTDMTLFNRPSFQNITQYLNKMLYLCFKYRHPIGHGFKQEDLDFYANQEVNWLTRATLFGGSKEAITTITPIYTELLEKTLTNGHMGTEENILTLITYLYPELCNIEMIEPPPMIEEFLRRLI